MRHQLRSKNRWATDYDFLAPLPPAPSALHPDHQLLVDAGLKFDTGAGIGVLSLKTGRNHPILQAGAESHAKYQARRGKQGHQQWDSRVTGLFNAAPEFFDLKEICAESWDDDTREEAAVEMYVSWQTSEGHWGAANGECDCWGYAMAFNEPKNIWYACAILGQFREKK